MCGNAIAFGHGALRFASGWRAPRTSVSAPNNSRKRRVARMIGPRFGRRRFAFHRAKLANTIEKSQSSRRACVLSQYIGVSSLGIGRFPAFPLISLEEPAANAQRVVARCREIAPRSFTQKRIRFVLGVLPDIVSNRLADKFCAIGLNQIRYGHESEEGKIWQRQKTPPRRRFLRQKSSE